MAKQRQSKALSAEDARLWRRVAETAMPLRARREDARAPEPVSIPESAPPARSGPVPTRNSNAATHKAPPLAAFAPREARRIAGGRQAIDARVDLHGLKQREAHRKLKTFLARAQARGQRTVLVITGKGVRAGEEDETFWERRDRGVLKAAVPLWLSEPEFRAYVVGFTPAHHRHGGEGALYVRLRRPGRRN